MAGFCNGLPVLPFLNGRTGFRMILLGLSGEIRSTLRKA